MNVIMDSPLVVFAVSLPVLWLAALIGVSLRKGWLKIGEDAREDFDLVLAATLTLLGLVIGFTFSMAVSRYDQRKNYEEEEANAIGTEYVRADLLPARDAARVRALLTDYLDQRLLFYNTHYEQQRRDVNAHTSQLQSELWSAVATPAAAQPTPLAALTVSGMNDVLNSQGYTQAAWWNRIPISAWALMAVIASFCNLLIGYRAGRTRALFYLILPLVVSISFFLIADIDSPRGGAIRVRPKNLEALSRSLRSR